LRIHEPSAISQLTMCIFWPGIRPIGCAHATIAWGRLPVSVSCAQLCAGPNGDHFFALSSVTSSADGGKSIDRHGVHPCCCVHSEPVSGADKLPRGSWRPLASTWVSRRDLSAVLTTCMLWPLPRRLPGGDDVRSPRRYPCDGDLGVPPPPFRRRWPWCAPAAIPATMTLVCSWDRRAAARGADGPPLVYVWWLWSQWCRIALVAAL